MIVYFYIYIYILIYTHIRRCMHNIYIYISIYRYLPTLQALVDHRKWRPKLQKRAPPRHRHCSGGRCWRWSWQTRGRGWCKRNILRQQVKKQNRWIFLGGILDISRSFWICWYNQDAAATWGFPPMVLYLMCHPWRCDWFNLFLCLCLSLSP